MPIVFLVLLYPWLATPIYLQAQPLDFYGLLDLLSKGSPIALAFFLICFIFEIVVPGRTYKAALAREREDGVKKDAEITRLNNKVDELSDQLVEAVKVAGTAVQATRRRTG